MVFWAKLDPIWAKWDPSGQIVQKVGKKALELGGEIQSFLPALYIILQNTKFVQISQNKGPHLIWILAFYPICFFLLIVQLFLRLTLVIVLCRSSFSITRYQQSGDNLKISFSLFSIFSIILSFLDNAVLKKPKIVQRGSAPQICCLKLPGHNFLLFAGWCQNTWWRFLYSKAGVKAPDDEYFGILALCTISTVCRDHVWNQLCSLCFALFLMNVVLKQ